MQLEGIEVRNSDFVYVVNSWGNLVISNCTANGKQIGPVMR
jgi:hypothetical protein